MPERFARSVSARRPLETVQSRSAAALGGLRFLAPFVLTLVAYDLQRYYLPWMRGEIHVEDIYRLERALFGIESAGRVLTPNELLASHLHPALDLATGLAYLLFIPQFLAVGLYFRFVLPRLRPPEYGPWIRSTAERMAWAFLLVNLLGYVTYVFFPAAPPWYVSLHGFAPPGIDTPPSPAGTARFDALLGTNVFQSMYSVSANVFGAVPSLHVSYPVIASFYAFRLRSCRALCLGFTGLIAFAAVYLNHHYVLDVILGALYGAFAASVTLRRRTSGA